MYSVPVVGCNYSGKNLGYMFLYLDIENRYKHYFGSERETLLNGLVVMDLVFEECSLNQL